MAAERNALMERIYPRLKVFAQQEGYEFQVSGPRKDLRRNRTRKITFQRARNFKGNEKNCLSTGKVRSVARKPHEKVEEGKSMQSG